MNINLNDKQQGFTIVELLVVIVVIGILASITIVSYNNVQNKARTASAMTNAQEVQNNADLYAAEIGNGIYPTNGTAFEAIATSEASSLSANLKTLLGTVVPSATAPTALIYQQCTTSGARVGYWDSMTRSVVYLYAGTATSATACSAAG